MSHKTRTISFQRITALQHYNNRLCGDICFNLDPNSPALNKAAAVLYWGWENECLLEGVGEEFLLSSPCELPWRRSLRCGKKSESHSAACFTFVSRWESTTNQNSQKALDKKPFSTHPIHKNKWKISHVYLPLQT